MRCLNSNLLLYGFVRDRGEKYNYVTLYPARGRRRPITEPGIGLCKRSLGVKITARM